MCGFSGGFSGLTARISRSQYITWLILLVFFAVCVFFPLLNILLCAKPSDFVAVFESISFREALRNTVLECLCSTSLSVLIGYVFAYAVERADIPFRRFFSLVPIIHLITPPFVGGLAFILLVGRQGLITHRLLGLDVSLYGFAGLVIAQVLCFFPMAYLICAQTLRGINRNLERAAESMGAGRLKIFLTVTLPLSRSGIAASFLFIAVTVLSDFGNPLIVAGRFRVLAVEIYTQLTGWLNAGTSAVLGIVLVIPSVAFFVLHNRFYKKNSLRLSSIARMPEGSGSDPSCSLVMRVLLSVFVALVSLCILLQLAAVCAGSFQKLWGINPAPTLSHIKAVRQYGTALGNSIRFALISSLLSTVTAVFTAFIVQRTDVPLRRTLDTLAQLPSAVPGSLLGLAISLAAARLSYRNSAVLIVIAMTVAFMPFSYRVISQSYGQLRRTLDEAALSLGANRITALLTVVAPLSLRGIYSGFVYDFIRGAGTLSAVIFLVSFNTPLASINIVNLAEQGDWGKSAALAFILTVITFLILFAGMLTITLLQKAEKRKSA